ncbi:MAG: hypothetical protein U0796_10205 [Gemmatales bacterium]
MLYIVDEIEPAALNDGFDAFDGFSDVLRTIPAALEDSGIVGQVLSNRTVAVLLEWICNTNFPQVSITLQLAEHLCRGRLVCIQWCVFTVNGTVPLL